MMHDVFMQTYSGRVVHLVNPRADEIHIADIAHALSQTCRFAGHTPVFHSVAHHSVLVADLLGPDQRLALWGLLHDASEAYLHDLTRPLKRVLNMASPHSEDRRKALGEAFAHDLVDQHIITDRYWCTVANTISDAIFEDRLGSGIGYAELEHRMMAAVCTRFGLPHLMPSAVKTADNMVLATEFRDLFHESPDTCVRWAGAEPMDLVITPLSPEAAKDLFLRRFNQLTRRAE